MKRIRHHGSCLNRKIVWHVKICSTSCLTLTFSVANWIWAMSSNSTSKLLIQEMLNSYIIFSNHISWLHNLYRFRGRARHPVTVLQSSATCWNVSSKYCSPDCLWWLFHRCDVVCEWPEAAVTLWIVVAVFLPGRMEWRELIEALCPIGGEEE